MKTLIALTALALLTACSTPTNTAQDHGQPLTADYKAAIQANLGRVLKDPDSAKVSFGEPAKAVFKSTGVLNPRRGTIYGYEVPVTINAKNSYGGYVGPKQYWFFFRDNELIAYHGTDDTWFDFRP